MEVIEVSDVIMSAEVIEAAEVFRTTKIIKINNLLARITLFWCYEKKNFLTPSWNYSEILPSLRTEAVEDRDVSFNQIKGSYTHYVLRATL